MVLAPPIVLQDPTNVPPCMQAAPFNESSDDPCPIGVGPCSFTTAGVGIGKQHGTGTIGYEDRGRWQHRNLSRFPLADPRIRRKKRRSRGGGGGGGKGRRQDQATRSTSLAALQRLLFLPSGTPSPHSFCGRTLAIMQHQRRPCPDGIGASRFISAPCNPRHLTPSFASKGSGTASTLLAARVSWDPLPGAV